MSSAPETAETKQDSVIDAEAESNVHLRTVLSGMCVASFCNPASVLHVESSKSIEDAFKLLAAAGVTEAHIFDDETSVRLVFASLSKLCY